MSTIVLPSDTVARIKKQAEQRAARRRVPPMLLALTAMRAVERRRLIASASSWRFGTAEPASRRLSVSSTTPKPLPVLTPSQRAMIASAVSAQRLDDLRADTADARRILARVVDELADRVDPSLRRRREARLRAAEIYRRIFGEAA